MMDMRDDFVSVIEDETIIEIDVENYFPEMNTPEAKTRCLRRIPKIFDDGRPRDMLPIPPPRLNQRKKRLRSTTKVPVVYRPSDYMHESSEEEIICKPRYRYIQPDLDDPKRRRSYLDEEFPDPVNNPLPRTLYDELHVPDNYTQIDFLKEMEINPIPFETNYNQLILYFSRPILQFHATLFYFIMHVHMMRRNVESTDMFLFVVITTILTYTWFRLELVHYQVDLNFTGLLVLFPPRQLRNDTRVSLIYVLISFQMAPVLQSVATTISFNSLLAFVGFMWCIHLFTCDYGVFITEGALSMSVQSGLVGAICLTCTMSSDRYALCTIILCVEMFLMFPMISYLFWDDMESIIYCVIVGYCSTYSVSEDLCLAYSCFIFFVVLIFPKVYVWLLGFKRNIYGPWDEANISACLKPPKKYASFAY